MNEVLVNDISERERQTLWRGEESGRKVAEGIMVFITIIFKGRSEYVFADLAKVHFEKTTSVTSVKNWLNARGGLSTYRLFQRGTKMGDYFICTPSQMY